MSPFGRLKKFLVYWIFTRTSGTWIGSLDERRIKR